METLELLTARLRSNPADHEAYRGLQSYYAARGDLGAVVNLVSERAPALGDGRTVSAAYVEAGDLLVQRGDPHGQAEALYHEALRRDPLNVAALEALLALWRAQERDEDAAEFLRREVRRLPQLGASPKQVAFVRYRLAELCDKRLHRYPEALQHYAEAFEQDPSFLRAMYDARQLHLAASNWRAAAELYEREAAAESNPERKAGLLRELAVLHSTRLGSIDGAIDALERAHALQPGGAEVSYELARALIQRAENHPTAGDGERIADLLSDLAAHLGPDRAVGYLETALRFAPAHEVALERLEHLLEGAPLRIAPHWVAYLAAAPNGRSANRRRLLLAHAYLRQGQLEDAVFCLGPAAQAGYAPAAQLLDELRASPRSPLGKGPAPAGPMNDGPSPLVAARQVARATPPPPPGVPRAHPSAGLPAPPPIGQPVADVNALRRQATELIARYRQDEAAAVYEQLLQTDPLDREAFAFLDGFLRRKQQHDRRTNLLERTASMSGLPPAVRAARLREAAGTYEARLKDFEGALRCLQLLSELEPGNADVARDRRRLLERAGRWDELVVLLEQELEACEDVDAKLTLLRRLASLHREQRADRVASAAVLERVLRLRPEDRHARDQLIEDGLALGRYEDVAALLEQKVEEALIRSQKLPALRQLAELYGDKLHDAVRTRAILERMLELTPKDLEILGQLAQLDERAGDHVRMLATLERVVSAAPGPIAAATLKRMSEIAELQLSDVDRAIALLGRAPQLSGGQREYGTAFAALLERHGRHAQLVTWLRSQIALERNSAARAEIHRRIAQLLQNELGDSEGAAAAWEELLALKEDREALLALQERALERDEPQMLVELLGRLSALEPDMAEKRDLLFERATLLATRLKRPEQALADLTRLLVEIDLEFEPALETLREVARASDDYHGLAQVLELRLQRPLSAGRELEHARELAELYQGQLVDSERAIGSLQRWAGADPHNPHPRRQLKPLLSRARRHAELLATLDELALVEQDEATRRQASLEAADLAQGELGDSDGAWQRLLPLVEQGVPAAVEAMVSLATKTERQGALYGLLERTGQHEVLLSLLRDRLADEENPGVRADFLRRIAHVLVEHKHDEAGAALAYRSLLELREDGEALRFLLAIATRDDDAASLGSILKRLADLESDPRERRLLLFRYAEVLTGRLGRAGEAVPILLDLAQESPDDAAVVEALVRACEAAHEHATLANVLEGMLARERRPDAYVTLARRLADVYELELQDSARSISALNKWAAAAPTDPEPHRRLRPHLQAGGMHRELLTTLDALAQLEKDPQARIDATLAAADLARAKLGEPQAAWQRLTPLVPLSQPRVDRALHLIAIETQRLDELYALLEQANRHDTLVEWLNQRVQHEPNRAVVVALYRRMARNLAGPLDDDAAAESAWLKLLESSEDAEGLNFLRAQALRRDDMQLLSDCLRRLAALELDPREKRDLLYEHGHLLRARLDRPAEAVSVLRNVIEQLDDAFEPALDELVEACRAAGDERTLVWAFERVLERETDLDRRAELARQLSELYAERLQETDRAIGALRAWAQAAPTDPEPHHRIVKLLSGSGRTQELLAALDAIAKLDDAPRRGQAIAAAAELAVEMGDPGGAFNRLLSLVNTGNQRAEALLWSIAFEQGRSDELITLYETVARHDDLVTMLKARAEASSDPGQRADLYRRCARLLVTPLGDEVAAAEAYREVLQFGEDEEALEFLRKRAIELDSPSELVDVLARLVALVNDPERRRALLYERAELLAGRLEQPQQAIDALRSLLLHVDAGFEPAIDLLLQLSEAASDREGLALALDSRLALAQTASARASLAQRLAEVYQTVLPDEAKAIAALRVWSEAMPDAPEPHRRLRPILERGQGGDALLRTLDALTSLEVTQAARAEAALSAAAVCFDRLQDAEGAWQRISALMLAGDPQAEEAARGLAERAGSYRALANLYVLRARKVASPRAPKQDWIEAARVYDAKLGEPREAFEAMVRAFALDTSDRGLLSELDRLAAAAGLWERLSHVYNKLVQQTGDENVKIDLLTRHADVLEQHAAQPGAVLERLMQACRLAPARSELLHRAEAIATLTQSHAELLWLYERMAQHAPAEDERVDLWLKAAKVADHGLKDREQALRDVRNALVLGERVPSAYARIEQLARELDQGRPELGPSDARQGLVQVYMALAQQPTAGDQGSTLVRHAARLLQEELDDDAGSFDALKQGAALFPHDLELYDALEQAAVRIKRLDALDAHLSRSIQRASDGSVKRALLRRRGHVLSEHLKRHAKAAEVYRELLQLDENDAAVFDALQHSLRRAGRLQELIKVYEERVTHTAALAERLELMRQMAKLWEGELKNRPAAVDVWRKIKAIAPSDGEASAALERLLS